MLSMTVDPTALMAQHLQPHIPSMLTSPNRGQPAQLQLQSPVSPSVPTGQNALNQLQLQSPVSPSVLTGQNALNQLQLQSPVSSSVLTGQNALQPTAAMTTATGSESTAAVLSPFKVTTTHTTATATAEQNLDLQNITPQTRRALVEQLLNSSDLKDDDIMTIVRQRAAKR